MDDENKIESFLIEHKKNIAIWSLIVIVIILVSGFIWMGLHQGSSNGLNNSASNVPSDYVVVSNNSQSGPTGTTTTVQQAIPKIGVITQNLVPVDKMANYQIDITSIGFSPSTITVNKGQSVIWTVRDKNTHWISTNPSDPYPEKGSCGSSFDSCGAVSLGNSFRMTFNVTGSWSYYDKLNPKFVGTVVVQ